MRGYGSSHAHRPLAFRHSSMKARLFRGTHRNRNFVRWIPIVILSLVSLTLSVSFWYLPSLVRHQQRQISTSPATTKNNVMSVQHAMAESGEVTVALVAEQEVEQQTPPTTIDHVPFPFDHHSSFRAAEKEVRKGDGTEHGDSHLVPTTTTSVQTHRQKAKERLVIVDEENDKEEAQQSPPPALAFGYASLEEQNTRSDRFPSIEERVQLYMTNWYLPPCDSSPLSDSLVHYAVSNDKMVFREARTAKEKIRGVLRTFLINSTTEFDSLHFVRSTTEFEEHCKNAYCEDMIKYLFPALGGDLSVPILFQFSDAEKTRAFSVSKNRTVAYPNIPEFKKFRNAISNVERQRVIQGECSTSPRSVPLTLVQEKSIFDDSKTKVIATSQPVVFKLKMQRHYGYVKSVPEQDRPWAEKKNQAIFRGQFTGRFPPGVSNVHNLPPEEQCQLLSRCRLVYNSALAAKERQERGEQPLVDAKLALPVLGIREAFPTSINNVALYGERMTVQDILSFKAIIMLEGNDVSSGLKWALFSGSVVMTQTPTKTSWAMEELLEPWVHFIPLGDDLSDVESKMQWVVDHDEEAQEIARRGRLWICDLVFHPDAEHDEIDIFQRIVARYKKHFYKDEKLFDDIPRVFNLGDVSR